MKKVILLCAVSLLVSACGGGGGDSSGNDVVFLGGVYSGVLNVTSNPCGLPIAPAMSVAWTVNQDQDSIVLESSSAQTFEGNTTSDNSLMVQKVVTDANACETNNLISIIDITDNSGHSNITIATRCGSALCSVSFEGDLVRK